MTTTTTKASWASVFARIVRDEAILAAELRRLPGGPVFDDDRELSALESLITILPDAVLLAEMVDSKTNWEGIGRTIAFSAGNELSMQSRHVRSVLWELGVSADFCAGLPSEFHDAAIADAREALSRIKKTVE